MERRDAIKNIALSTGVIISSGTFLSLLQSCQQKDKIEWVPGFFSNEEAITVSEVANIILPADELPGALDVNVPQVIDLLMKDVFEAAYSDKFKKGLKVFSDKFQEEYGAPFHEGSQENQQAFVEKLYNLPNEESKAILDLVKKKTAPAGREENYLLYSFLVTERDLTIKSYFTSEKVGEEILSYDPVPGRQEGCVPVEDIGNVWSI